MSFQSTPFQSTPSRPSLITLTEPALNHARAVLLRAKEPVVGLRIGIKNGGCAGMSYTVAYALAVDPLDEVVQIEEVRLLIDPKAVLFLLGMRIDYQTSKLRSGFVFENPNQTSACGCGESVALAPAHLG